FVTKKNFSIDYIIEKYATVHSGAVVIFVGKVRGFYKNLKVEKLILESYEEMANEYLTKIRKKAIENFGLEDAIIIHRLGDLSIGENIVTVLAFSAHRKDAFQACKWMIDTIKREVPIWKKEITKEGNFWVKEEKDEKEKSKKYGQRKERY
ncbi:MAG: molybdenum cofactor biosynthesis protein MoaE, partial [Thermoplasmata archaeon]